MSTKYKATEADVAYFITITVLGWIDIFTRLKQKLVIINAPATARLYRVVISLYIFANADL